MTSLCRLQPSRVYYWIIDCCSALATLSLIHTTWTISFCRLLHPIPSYSYCPSGDNPIHTHNYRLQSPAKPCDCRSSAFQVYQFVFSREPRPRTMMMGHITKNRRHLVEFQKSLNANLNPCRRAAAAAVTNVPIPSEG